VGPTDNPSGFLRLAREQTPPHRPWIAMLLAVAIAAGAALLARRRVTRFERRVARHLTGWSDLPTNSDLEALAEDADRHFRAERESLSRELEATKAALAEVSEGVILLDGEGTVRFANPAASAHLGRTLTTGRPLLEAVRIPELIAAVSAVLEGGGDRHTTCSDPQGPELAVRVCSVPHPVLAAAVVLHDLQGERQLEKARRALVADLAHELRTPLTVLGGVSEELRDGGTSDELLATLDRQIGRLRTFAQDLEELDAIESGRILLEATDIDAGTVVRQVLADLGRKSESLGIELDSTVGDLHLVTDQTRLAQVLTNLVDNGIRYNRKGGKVMVSAREVADGVRFEVEDNGIGIPAAEMPLVFQRFYRVRRGSQPERGSGLGLAIVKHLVRALGGTVQLTSTEGSGTTVTVTLPRRQS
jgi:two-component system phosphate regulon sensor histidine kinase PhoR